MFRRANAENHLLIIIVTFAASVLGIRAYLYVTGYPQLGNGELHIAHMLWGGLALFVGSTMLLLYRGLYLSRIVAVLTGVGWGFFIDEIGKFLTRSNDYFFAPAAVIIYMIFLVVTTIYLLYFRKRTKEPASDDREAFSDLRELLDGVAAGELTHRERQLLELRLETLKSDDEKIFRDLGHSIQAFVNAQPITIRQRRVENIGAWFDSFINYIVVRKTFVAVLVGLIAVDVMISLSTIIGFGPFQGLIEGERIGNDNAIQIVSLIVRLVLQATIIIGFVLAERGNVVLGRRLMIGALLFIIVILDSIDFYFSQFSTAYTVALDVFLLAMIEARYGSERFNPERANKS